MLPPHTQLISKWCQSEQKKLTSQLITPELKPSEMTLHKWKVVVLDIMWTHLYSVFRSWNCTSAAACSLRRLTRAGRQCFTWRDKFSCRENQGCNQRLGEILLCEWRGQVREEFIKLQWHGWLEGRVGSSYPVSKPRPVSPWTSRRPQTQRRWWVKVTTRPQITKTNKRVSF